MSAILEEVLTANNDYASHFGNKGNLPLPPGRHFAILTCMDARLDPAKLDDKGWHDHGNGPGSVHGHFIKWHTIADQPASVTADVARIRSHPLVPKTIPIYGYIYDVKTGRLTEVKAATAAGSPVAA